MVARCAETPLGREQGTAGSVMWTLDADFRDDGFNSHVEILETLVSGESPSFCVAICVDICHNIP